MRLAVRLGLFFIVANALAWLVIGGEGALSLIIGVELGLLLVARHFAAGSGGSQIQARLNVLVVVNAAAFVVVVVVSLAEVLAG